jgi:hypothetical protein
VNTLVSFVYTLLAHNTAAALETAGLDPYVGFLHRDRPGRISLALEELLALSHLPFGNPEKGSLRFYYLGDHYKTKIEHFGAKPAFDAEDPIIV